MARAHQGDQSQANVIIHILEAAEVKGVVSAHSDHIDRLGVVSSSIAVRALVPGKY